jgi:hypothetical protein
MIKSITQLIVEIQADLSRWGETTKPWFRGESGNHPTLCPKIAKYTANEENYLLQSFRRQAGGLANSPPRQGHTDMWLFKAQHYGIPTRLLDWTEGGLHALYFAINSGNLNPRMYMLNPHHLNELAIGHKLPDYEFPLSWGRDKIGTVYVSLAWQHRNLAPEHMNVEETKGWNLDIPIAFPATYQDQRMIAQRSCFTIHGITLKPLSEILKNMRVELADYLIEYEIDFESRKSLLRELSILGISAATIFPDLDHLSQDLINDAGAK